MPFRSEKQRRYLWLKHPEIARRWSKEYGSTPKTDADEKPKRRKKRLKHKRTAGTSDRIS